MVIKLKFYLIVLFLILVFTACQNQQQTSVLTLPPPDCVSATPEYPLHPATPIPSATITMTPPPNLMIGLTHTALPPGVFAIVHYPPLIMHYNPLQWRDFTPYGHTSGAAYNANWLSNENILSCSLSVRAEMESIFPAEFEVSKNILGEVKYTVFKSLDTTYDTVAFYYAGRNIKNYEDKTFGEPIFMVTSANNEWESCQEAVEEVLSSVTTP